MVGDLERIATTTRTSPRRSTTTRSWQDGGWKHLARQVPSRWRACSACRLQWNESRGESGQGGSRCPGLSFGLVAVAVSGPAGRRYRRYLKIC